LCANHHPLSIFSGTTLLAVDLSGSGMSDGEYISLGIYEKEDVVCIVKHLRDEGKTSKVDIPLFICCCDDT
jgi:hypothetical protein